MVPKLAQQVSDDSISFVTDMAAAVPLLEDRDLVDGQGERARPAAYVRRDFVCQVPVTEVEALRAQLELGLTAHHMGNRVADEFWASRSRVAIPAPDKSLASE
jgi:hypothetical protein